MTEDNTLADEAERCEFMAKHSRSENAKEYYKKRAKEARHLLKLGGREESSE